MSIFGIAATSGAAVNDGLAPLDRCGIIRREKPLRPAIAAAAAATRSGFRTAFPTSPATVPGRSPSLCERSDAMLFLAPFAASMVGGLAMSALFVLFAMPAMVIISEGGRE